MDIDFFLAAGHLNLTVLVKVMRLHCSFIQEEIQAEVTVIDIGFCCVCRCACVRACVCVCVCVCVFLFRRMFCVAQSERVKGA